MSHIVVQVDFVLALEQISSQRQIDARFGLCFRALCELPRGAPRKRCVAVQAGSSTKYSIGQRSPRAYDELPRHLRQMMSMWGW